MASGLAASKAQNANRSIWTLDVTKFRKEHAVEGGYTKQWDPSDLPQNEVQRKGRYTPLTGAFVKAQLAKLEPGAKP